MRTIEDQIRDYAKYADEVVGWADVEHIIASPDGVRGSRVSPTRRSDDLMIDYFQQRPDQGTAPSQQMGWSGVVVVVAAIILVVVGAAVVANGNSRVVVADPASAPSATDPVATPTVDEPVASPGVDESTPSNERSGVPEDPPVFRAMFGVTVGGPGLVAVGGRRNAAVWTSIDGITWSRLPHDEAVFGSAWMNAVIVGGPGLLAVGSIDFGEAKLR